MKKDKYLEIMADFSSTGLWDREGIMVMFEEIPELPFWWIPEFKEWTEWYEENDDWMEDSINDFPYAEFSVAGRVLAQKLANVLKDWEIWYFDEHAMFEDIYREDAADQKYLERITHEYQETQK